MTNVYADLLCHRIVNAHIGTFGDTCEANHYNDVAIKPTAMVAGRSDIGVFQCGGGWLPMPAAWRCSAGMADRTAERKKAAFLAESGLLATLYA